MTYELEPDADGTVPGPRPTVADGADDRTPEFSSVTRTTAGSTARPSRHQVPDPLADQTPGASSFEARRRAAATAEYAAMWRRACWVLGVAWTLAILTMPLHGAVAQKAGSMAGYLAGWMIAGGLGFALLSLAFRPTDGWKLDGVRTLAVAGIGCAAHSLLTVGQTFFLDILVPLLAMFVAMQWLRDSDPFEAVVFAMVIFLMALLPRFVGTASAQGRAMGGPVIHEPKTTLALLVTGGRVSANNCAIGPYDEIKSLV